MGFVLPSGKAEDEVLIESQGDRPHSSFHRRPGAPDAGQSATVEERSAVKNGDLRHSALARMQPSSLIADAESGFLSLVDDLRLAQPASDAHARTGSTQERLNGQATDPGWTKWRPSQPTSAHWYNAERLSRLMAAEIAHAEDHRTACPSVRDFIGQFRGLSGTAKAERSARRSASASGRRWRISIEQRIGAAASLMLQAMRDIVAAGEAPRSRRRRPRRIIKARFVDDWADPKSFVYR